MLTIKRITTMLPYCQFIYEVEKAVQANTQFNCKTDYSKHGVIKEIRDEGVDFGESYHSIYTVYFENGSTISLENVPVQVEKIEDMSNEYYL